MHARFPDEDKKKAAAEQRKANKKGGVTSTGASTPTAAATSTSHSDANSDASESSSTGNNGAATSATASNNGRARQQPQRRRGYRPSDALPETHLSSSPMRELEDEEEEEEEEEEEKAGEEWGYARKSSAELPKHHAQLYELYGEQADYFLHPKPAQATPRRRPTHPKLRNPKGQRFGSLVPYIYNINQNTEVKKNAI